MDRGAVQQAFAAEAAAVEKALSGVGEAAWRRPTRCAPWTVAELFAHVVVVVGRLDGMLDAPAPARAEVTAAEYYRPDARFAPTANADRIALARDRAADGPALLAEHARTWRDADRRCRAEPDGRVVRTRHGDPMLLTDFLTTRVVELAVHGLDLADALDHAPWLTGPAADLLDALLLADGDADPDAVRAELGWDRPAFLRKATGRTPLDRAEQDVLARTGLTWLTLG
ncbi:maleylpyruvate isomerase N-terminal domain-containing protein [Kitasatospora phosalacinea]|uniref:Mycothiol-dependent maleylpyruvate isomerase metal-binding domain-containing protein n=1 Tax=Kitasatospora phosalacinea TaxID=2065 RepID=A0A9W6PJ85_9ACTN|nr:maleylpyruvate isomerase N-terminal domain-containing protein [Kitasatospora phosalacinea]GLW56020.1 hypothetical protein Kpho01_40310 [Kitasatospora phosalacinea]